MNNAEHIVKVMLEADHDEHVKAHQLVQKWDNAHNSFAELRKLHQKRNALFRETGEAIGLERALARVGLKRENVAHYLRGEQIRATDNYKHATPAKICRNNSCSLLSVGGNGSVWQSGARHRYQAADLENCPGCQEPLETIMKPTSPSDLRDNLARHILGVETTNGRKVWFDQPVEPR